jgi:predicted type IV restriction endonuclease
MRKAKTVKQLGRLRRSTSDITKFEVAKLELHKGDILVLRTDQMLSKDKAVLLRKLATQSVPKGVKVMILAGGLSLAVLQDKRAA